MCVRGLAARLRLAAKVLSVFVLRATSRWKEGREHAYPELELFSYREFYSVNFIP